MKKIPSLFERAYEGDHLVFDEVVPGSEWVLADEGVPTEKFDGTACMVEGGVLYKRRDRKRVRGGPEYRAAPEDWFPAQAPDPVSGHWPGWLPVGDGPEDKYHREAFSLGGFQDATYELVGPKVQGNPYSIDSHRLWLHGAVLHGWATRNSPRNFDSLREWMLDYPLVEGIVWHHPDGRMVKIKRRDFGLPWPPTKEEKS